MKALKVLMISSLNFKNDVNYLGFSFFSKIDSLEFFSDIKINSFGARVDVNGKKERYRGYHVRNLTFAFAFCLRRWWHHYTTSTSYTDAAKALMNKAKRSFRE